MSKPFVPKYKTYQGKQVLLKASKSVKKYVKSAISRSKETIYEQTDDDNKAVSFAAPIVNDIANADETTRLGNKILVKSIRGAVDFNCSAAVPATWARVMIVQDKGNQGTVPAFTDIYPGMTITKVGTAQQGEVAKDNFQRFKILYDKVKMIGYEAGDMGNALKRFPINLRLSVPVYFNGTSSTDESKNHIFMFIIPGSNDADIKTSYDVRTGYKDV